MKIRSEAGGDLVVLLERGDALRASIEGLARDKEIKSARVRAIGALEDPEVAYYHLDRKAYAKQVLPGIHELVSLEGNLTLKEGEPMLHAHVALGGPDFMVRGGHLVDARVAVVVELFIEPTERAIHRAMDEAVGLPVWSP